jgi:putative phage-type endonuclease
VAGLNPFSSPFYLYNDKLGLLQEKEDSEAMRQGRDLEQYVAQRWMEATGKKCRRNNFMWRSGEHPFMLADIDREVVGENAGLECKTTSVYNKSDFEGGSIPLPYYVQCMHYMAVMGFARMYLAVLVMSKGFFHFVIERDENEIEALTQKEADFWEMVATKTPPPPDGSEATMNALRQLHPEENEQVVTLLGHDVREAFRKMFEYRTIAKDYEAAAETQKAIIMAQMGDAQAAETDGYAATWRTQERSAVDTKRLQRMYPSVYEQCVKTTTSRVFRAKEKKMEE